MTKRIIFPVLILLLALFNFSSTIPENPAEEIELKWKMSAKPIVYKTIMNDIGESTFEANFGGLFDKLRDSTKSSQKEFMNKLKGMYENTSLKTVLTRSKDFQGVFDIEMIADDKKEKNSFLQGTVLRGSMYENGTLHSFWLKNAQKNLISLLFELPGKPLKKGDSWTLDNVNFIGNDQNFVCRKASKTNKITLSDILLRNGETIAIIDYDIYEYVSGEFSMALLDKKSEPTTMEFIYRGQAEFSVEKGKWVTYNGIMSLDATGIMTSKQKQQFALIEE